MTTNPTDRCAEDPVWRTAEEILDELEDTERTWRPNDAVRREIHRAEVEIPDGDD
jgi:hypothetical protein